MMIMSEEINQKIKCLDGQNNGTKTILNMSYRDPKRAVYNRADIINKGIQNTLMGITKNRQAFAAEQKRKEEREKAALDKVSNVEDKNFQAHFLKAQQAANKFTSGLTEFKEDPTATGAAKGKGKFSESGKMSKDALSFQNQITEILFDIKNELAEQLSNQDLTAAEIRQYTNEAIMKSDKFATDMANWELARQEYYAAKALPPGSPGSILNNWEAQENADMINLFETMVDETDDKLIISIDQESGNTLISGVKSTTTPASVDATTGAAIPAVTTSKDVTVWAQEHKDKGEGHYFKTNEAFTHADLSKIKTLMADLEGGDHSTNALLGNDDLLDKDKTLKFLKEDEIGKRLVAGNYQGDESKWAAIDVDSEEAYLNYVIDQGWNLHMNERK